MTNMRTLTDNLAWRLLPGPRYFRELRIAKACPEIRGQLNRIRLLQWGGLVFAVPAYALLLPFTAMRWLSDLVLDMPTGWMPNFSERRRRAVDEALKIVPLEEIRRRMGNAPAIISAKP